jgi:transposase-like protein
MTSEFEEIRQQIANLSRAKNARRYPRALQARITAHARMRIAGGMSVGAVCRELDVGEPTMSRFLGPQRPSAHSGTSCCTTATVERLHLQFSPAARSPTC